MRRAVNGLVYGYNGTTRYTIESEACVVICWLRSPLSRSTGSQAGDGAHPPNLELEHQQHATVSVICTLGAKRQLGNYWVVWWLVRVAGWSHGDWCLEFR